MKRKKTPVATVAPEEAYAPVRSGFRPGEKSDCPDCGASMAYQRGLTYLGRNRYGLVAVANLAGFRCGTCGHQSWDPPSYDAIRATLAREPAGFGAHAKVSRLAGQTLGAYFPKALQEHMGIHAGDELVLQPLDERLLLVEVRHGHELERRASD